ncbi:uncharacterized protein N7484_002834 [Penicillium longicatenatum]|uniref:uncharacterized protein n=1 Tax=Penicillium longicatenatum TaxID=1561947 RepID=UPI0025476F05|nr:uncharacterized protein N7484_002834 [Penicillium longicatenatum]KAJ5649111.1 hypothetical protein N7484_002834 [Penicillium longicatenatum]
MSWQPKLRPKGFPHSIDDFAVASLSELEHRSRGDEKRDQRVFRVKRKHVLKACDRCRVKKTKCDGKQPCNRCSVYNHPCLFRERKATQTKVYSRGFVEMLESHHSLVVKALQKLYKFCITNEGFPGDPLEEAPDGHPLTHAILDRLGLIKQAEENADEPDEDSEDLRYLRLLSTSTECSATAEPSPEPATPPEPSPTRRSRPSLCTNPTPTPSMTRNAPSWGWDMQSMPQSGGGYNSFPDAAYQNLMGLPRSSGMGSLDLGPSEISPHVDIATGSSSLPHGNRHEQGYTYYLDGCADAQADVKPAARMHTGIMRPMQHQMGLPGDLLNDFPFHAQDSPYFPGFTPGWSFPST